MKPDNSELDRTMPTGDGIPENCAWGGCDKEPRKAVKYTSPKEWVCYCNKHAAKADSEIKKSQYMKELH